MRKTDKKLDNQIRKALTDVCETALKDFSGFQWLTHLVDYTNFPKSLKVICVFDTSDSLNAFTARNGCHELSTLIQKRLFEISIDVKTSQISFNTEENCNIS